MLKISLQFFAHKKGVGLTKNGRDSESADWAKACRRSTGTGRQHLASPARHQDPPGCGMLAAVRTTPCSQRLRALFAFERLGKDRKQVSVYPQ